MAIDTFRTATNERLLAIVPMAPFACNFVMNPLDLEGTKIMSLPYVYRPAIRCVAANTIRSLLTLVNIDVTAFAVGGRTRVLIIDMTLTTFGVYMPTLKLVIRLLLVVKISDRRPPFWRMTSLARTVKLPLMKIVMTIRAC